jgi:hypothetical protein
VVLVALVKILMPFPPPVPSMVDLVVLSVVLLVQVRLLLQN